jgi:DeoR family fructose operon transcriptional repressor
MTVVQGSFASDDRMTWLTEKLTTDGIVTINDAAAELGVSEMTIRRDLTELELRGLARRVRGGAKAVGPQTFAQRRDRGVRAKAKVASKLSALVPQTGAIALDASTTVMRLVGTLDAVRDLVVLTNGPDTFNALQELPGITPLLTGGQLDRRTGSLVGPLACRAAAQVAVQVLFASAAAVDPRFGALETTLEEAEVKRALATSAEQIVLAVDSSKLASRALATGIEWERIDLLVTELDPNDARLDDYRRIVEIR